MTVPTEVRRVVDEWDAQGRCRQPAMGWQRDRWVVRYPALVANFNALPDQLDRATVRANVLDKPATNQGMFEAMNATYAWGWSVTRAGIGRAARVSWTPALRGSGLRYLARGHGC